MNRGDKIHTTCIIRSPRSGIIMPREGIFLSTINNLGRQLWLIEFSGPGIESEQVYLLPDEIKELAQ